MIKALNPAGLATPMGPYSHVVTVPAAGQLVFCAGTIATDDTGRVVGQGDMAAQTEQVMENLKVALSAAGASLEDVVKITTYVTDASRYPELAEVRARYLTEPFPASTLIEVKALILPELMVESDAVAVVGE